MAVQPSLCGTWSETPKTGFLTTRLFCFAAVCKGGCGSRGKCVSPGKCECIRPYTGKDCQEKQTLRCSSPCLNGGRCRKGKCKCPPTHYGNSCQHCKYTSSFSRKFSFLNQPLDAIVLSTVKFQQSNFYHASKDAVKMRKKGRFVYFEGNISCINLIFHFSYCDLLPC